MTTTQPVQYTPAGPGRYRVTVDGATVGTVSRWLRGTPSWRWESYLPDGVTVNKRSPLSYPTREKATELLLTFGNPPPPRTEPDVVPGFDLIDACDARPGDVIRFRPLARYKDIVHRDDDPGSSTGYEIPRLDEYDDLLGFAPGTLRVAPGTPE